MVGFPSFEELQRTQPISAEKLPLPDGAATSANQTATQSPVGATVAPSAAIVVQGNDAGTPVPVSVRGLVVLSASSVINMEAAYNSTPPVVVDGTTTPLQADSHGNLKTAIIGGVDVSGSLVGVSGTVAISGSVPVTGAFFPATQPISAASLPLPAGAATAANQPAVNADGGALAHVTNFPATQAVQGDVASAAADSGNPQKIGGLAKTANPTAVADGQRVNALYDKLGKLVVIHSLRELRGVQQTTISGTAETTIVIAGAAGVFNDLYALVIANTSATAVNVTLKDATGGTTRGIFQIPASATTICFQLDASDGIPQAAAANNWTLTSSVAVTSLQVMALYVKNL